ncbi:DNA topoisomerase VI subunit B [archaeon CG07_land_8_20_14_0_80_38_8]|nr:MAG: DNA topoisomerase VI subunit B [archaeon CG07_land_8_20_14_0_80_38_8]PIU89227.1 MAG: DNA topoisomerase VI subunit B [archaeon CG06_land_8_20_14_3_00_37_11]
MNDKTVADDLAKKHKSISIAEFFEKNRHLLGFDSKVKAMLTCVKEAVDNSLDACEENASELKKKKKNFELPNILVRIDNVQNDIYKIIVEDNGPGISPKIIPQVFAKLLYGSKFHRLKQGRGQQGIGISASILYGQLTTGKPARIISRISPNQPARIVELMIDIKNNDASIIRDEEFAKFANETGTRVEIIIEGTYYKTGDKSVYEYLRRTSIVNPHARITFIEPDGNKIIFKRAVESLPRETKEIKPHPWGLELGILIRMLKETKKNTVLSFLTDEFSKMGSTSAKAILEHSKVNPKRKPSSLTVEEATDVLKFMQKAELQRPPTDCLSPVGRGAIEKSLKLEYNPEFIAATTRAPNVYRGYPFQVESAIAYGGDIPEGNANLMRIANKVPLLYESGACAITAGVSEMDWKRYGVNKPSNSSMPQAPLILLVHICSVWVPFTSESKAAIANYPIIIKEIKLSLQECARQLNVFLRKKMKAKKEALRISTFIKYGGVMAKALSDLTNKDSKEIEKTINKLIEKKFGINADETKKRMIEAEKKKEGGE